MRTLRYGILGFGNVGAALAAHAAARSARIAETRGTDIELGLVADSSHALVSAHGLDANDLARRRDSGSRVADLPGAVPLAGIEVLRPARLDCLVVCLPTNRHTGEPGLTWARAAIDSGCSVVLADKGPALIALPELEEAAAARGVAVGASATVGSALPTLSVAKRELAGASIREISAILNGTTNMILTMMRTSGVPYADALGKAQRLGVAEPDPSADVEGWDTAIKLTILARSLMERSITLADVERRGIDMIPSSLEDEARRSSGRLRLVGRAVRTGAKTELTVAPEVVAANDPFYLVEGPSKGVKFVTDDFGTLTVLGGASGRTDVAAALLKDILSTDRGNA